MQYSMTGFGRSQRTSKDALVKTEIKTLNSKFLDYSPKYSSDLIEKEAEIRTMISSSLKRGKVILTIELMGANQKNTLPHIDQTLFSDYYAQFKKLASDVGAGSQDAFRLAIGFSKVVREEENLLEHIGWEEVKRSISEAIEQCLAFREKEGKALVEKLHEYVHTIRAGLEQIHAADAHRRSRIKLKMQKQLEEIKDKIKIDENRLEQELIYYVERLDISEEKVRLNQHLSFFEDTMVNEKYAGKKLGFIAQEIGREINTIGSKANHAEIQRIIVGMKDELEKIKEQILNLI